MLINHKIETMTPYTLTKISPGSHVYKKKERRTEELDHNSEVTEARIMQLVCSKSRMDMDLGIREVSPWGTWVAQWLTCPTPDFGSGHNLLPPCPSRLFLPF